MERLFLLRELTEAVVTTLKAPMVKTEGRENSEESHTGYETLNPHTNWHMSFLHSSHWPALVTFYLYKEVQPYSRHCSGYKELETFGKQSEMTTVLPRTILQP